MADIFHDDFDTYKDGALAGNNGWTGDSSHLIQSVDYQSGRKGVKVLDAAETDEEVYRSFTASSVLYFLFYFKIPVAGDPVKNLVIYFNLDDAVSGRAGVIIDGITGVISDVDGQPVQSFDFNQWVKVQMNIDAVNQPSKYRLKIGNGSWSSWITSSYTFSTLSRVAIDVIPYGGDFIFDTLYITTNEYNPEDVVPFNNWGMMTKSQVDSETVEDAINRLILVHEADPESHLDTGESLQSHKAEAIIDHVAGSVLADKLSNTEGIFDTNFETLDNWLVTGAVSLESWPSIKIRGDFAATAIASIETTLVHPDYWLLYTKNMLFQFFGWMTNPASSIYTAIIGEYVSDSDLRGFGFQILNGVVKGFWGKIASTTFTATISIDESKPHVFRAYYDAYLKNIKFYVDGVYYATIEDIGSPEDSEPQILFQSEKKVSGTCDFWLQKITASREA